MGTAAEPLAVDIDLEVSVEGTQCAVWTEDSRIVVNAPSLAAARSLLAGIETLPVSPDTLTGPLSETDLTLEVQVRYAPVARVGAGVVPSRGAEAMGYDADVSLYGLAVAAWRRLL